MIELMIIINGLLCLPPSLLLLFLSLSLSFVHSLSASTVYKFVLYFIIISIQLIVPSVDVEYGMGDFNTRYGWKLKCYETKVVKTMIRVCGYQVSAARYIKCVHVYAARDALSLYFLCYVDRWEKTRTTLIHGSSISILLAVGNFVLNFIFVLVLSLLLDIKFSTQPLFSHVLIERVRRLAR